MTDSRQMFLTLMRAFVEHIPRAAWGDMRRLVTLAWAVVGLCLSKKVSLPGWGEAVESRAQKAASRTRRFARWVDNPKIQVQPVYAPLLRAALCRWQTAGRVYLALDVSVLKGSPFVLIRVALIYRGRAMPLAWRVLRHASATVGFADYQPVLDQASRCLPLGLTGVLLADRGFVHAELLQWLQQAHWHYRLRLTGDTLIHCPDRRVVAVARLCPPSGEAHFYHGIRLLGHAFGPLHLALAQLDAPNQDPWYLVSDEPTDLTTFDEYGLRFDLEMVFTQMTKGRVLARGRRWDHVTDFHRFVVDDDSVDPQRYQLSALGEVELLARRLQAPPEVFDAGGELGGVQLLLGLCRQLA